MCSKFEYYLCKTSYNSRYAEYIECALNLIITLILYFYNITEGFDLLCMLNRQIPELRLWLALDQDTCKRRCAEDIECVVASSQIEGKTRMCAHLTKTQMDMTSLMSSPVHTDAVGFIKQCS